MGDSRHDADLQSPLRRHDPVASCGAALDLPDDLDFVAGLEELQVDLVLLRDSDIQRIAVAGFLVADDAQVIPADQLDGRIVMGRCLMAPTGATAKCYLCASWDAEEDAQKQKAPIARSLLGR